VVLPESLPGVLGSLLVVFQAQLVRVLAPPDRLVGNGVLGVGKTSKEPAAGVVKLDLPSAIPSSAIIPSSAKGD